jgi:hypothetical protein
MIDFLSRNHNTIDVIVSQTLDVFQAVAVAQNVAGDIQDMIGFIIGHMASQQFQWIIEALDQTGLAGQKAMHPIPP